MKKIILMVAIVFSFCGTTIWATHKNVVNEETMCSSERYESMDRSVDLFYVYNGRLALANSYKLYKGINTCDAYYVYKYPDYCALRRNTKSTFKGVDVSNFGWVCYQGSETYFCNF